VGTRSPWNLQEEVLTSAWGHQKRVLAGDGVGRPLLRMTMVGKVGKEARGGGIQVKGGGFCKGRRQRRAWCILGATVIIIFRSRTQRGGLFLKGLDQPHHKDYRKGEVSTAVCFTILAHH
jgi:hypothetical protein